MRVEISDGELLDKISILQIKSERISDQSKLKNIQTEYIELTSIGASLLEDEQVYTLYEKVRRKTPITNCWWWLMYFKSRT